MEKMKENLRAIAKEYARQFGQVIGMELEFFVADNPIGIASFGDCYFFNLNEMAHVVDNLDKYVRRYGSKEAVGNEVIDWMEWWLADSSQAASLELMRSRVTHQLRPNINLSSWLDGCPREDRKPFSGPEEEYMRLSNNSDVLERLIDDYGDKATLIDVLADTRRKLSIENEARMEQRHKEWLKLIGKVNLSPNKSD